jgi:hypothetical protein
MTSLTFVPTMTPSALVFFPVSSFRALDVSLTSSDATVCLLSFHPRNKKPAMTTTQ